MNAAGPEGISTGGFIPFRRVLLICNLTDSDEALFDLGAKLVRDTGAKLTVLGAVDKRNEINHIARFSKVSTSDVRDRLSIEISKQLEAHVKGAGLAEDVDFHVSCGKPFLDIIHRVLDEGYDLVIKAAETIGAPGGSILASTDQHLLRKCPCPVWLMMPSQKPQTTAILAAIDIDEFVASDPETMNALNRTILELATNLCLLQGATLHVLHVWDAPAEGMTRLFSPSDESVNDYLRSVQVQHRAALDSLIADVRSKIGESQFDMLKLKHHLVQGDARDMIPLVARDVSADILVMGTIARTGIPGFIIGNTAEDVLNSVSCSVVTAKPPGYVSPVVAGSSE